MIKLQPDFKEFLKLLNAHGVKYILVGGYAVSFHGFPRATGDMDLWVEMNDENAERISAALHEFGMPEESVPPELFLDPENLIRIGIPPVQIEIMTTVSGVDFGEYFANSISTIVEGTEFQVIGLDDLKKNKKAAGRYKDLEDLENLP